MSLNSDRSLGLVLNRSILGFQNVAATSVHSGMYNVISYVGMDLILATRHTNVTNSLKHHACTTVLIAGSTWTLLLLRQYASVNHSHEHTC